MPGSLRLFAIQVILPVEVAELVVAQTERFGCPALVPVRIGQRAPEQSELEGLDLGVEPFARRRRISAGDLRRQIRGFNGRARGHARRAFHCKLELAHVPGPRVALQVSEGAVGKRTHREPRHLPDNLLDEERGKRLNVFTPFAKRGNADNFEAEAVVEIPDESGLRQSHVRDRHSWRQ